MSEQMPDWKTFDANHIATLYDQINSQQAEIERLRALLRRGVGLAGRPTVYADVREWLKTARKATGGDVSRDAPPKPEPPKVEYIRDDQDSRSIRL